MRCLCLCHRDPTYEHGSPCCERCAFCGASFVLVEVPGHHRECENKKTGEALFEGSNE